MWHSKEVVQRAVVLIFVMSTWESNLAGRVEVLDRGDLYHPSVPTPNESGCVLTSQ
jgi:hypothetical protein